VGSPYTTWTVAADGTVYVMYVTTASSSGGTTHSLQMIKLPHGSLTWSTSTVLAANNGAGFISLTSTTAPDGSIHVAWERTGGYLRSRDGVTWEQGRYTELAPLAPLIDPGVGGLPVVSLPFRRREQRHRRLRSLRMLEPDRCPRTGRCRRIRVVVRTASAAELRRPMDARPAMSPSGVRAFGSNRDGHTLGRESDVSVRIHGARAMSRRMAPQKPRRTTARRIVVAFGAVLLLFALALAVMLISLNQIGAAEDEVARLDHAKHAGHHAAAMAREQYMHQAHTLITWDGSHLGHYGDVAKEALEATHHLKHAVAGHYGEAQAEQIAGMIADSDRRFLAEVWPAIQKNERARMSELHEITEVPVAKVVALNTELNRKLEGDSDSTARESSSKRCRRRSRRCCDRERRMAPRRISPIARSSISPVTARPAST